MTTPAVTPVPSPADVAARSIRPDPNGILRVAAGSNVADLAGAIANAIYVGQVPKLRAVGAGAVNQAIKACAVASGYIAPTGRTMTVRPGFQNIQSHDGMISAITLKILVDE